VHAFEAILALLFGATILSSFARRVGMPYPALLASGARRWHSYQEPPSSSCPRT